MKKVMLLALALAALTFSVSAADDAAPKKEKAKKALSPEVIKKYDKDGDGTLNKEEMKAYRADQKKDKPAK